MIISIIIKSPTRQTDRQIDLQIDQVAHPQKLQLSETAQLWCADAVNSLCSRMIYQDTATGVSKIKFTRNDILISTSAFNLLITWMDKRVTTNFKQEILTALLQFSRPNRSRPQNHFLPPTITAEIVNYQNRGEISDHGRSPSNTIIKETNVYAEINSFRRLLFI